MCFFFLFNALKAQTVYSYKKFDKEAYEKATKDVNYTEDFEKKKEKPREPKNDQPRKSLNLGNWDMVADLLKGLGIGGLVLLLAYLVFRIFDENVSNKKIANIADQSIIENLEQHIHEVDLNDFLKQALASKNFKLAVRIYYLSIIKNLSNSNLIVWKKQKTNGEYMSELFGQPLFEDFRKSTLVFERVWLV